MQQHNLADSEILCRNECRVRLKARRMAIMEQRRQYLISHQVKMLPEQLDHARPLTSMVVSATVLRVWSGLLMLNCTAASLAHHVETLGSITIEIGVAVRADAEANTQIHAGAPGE